jgi:hypothetical protein
MLFAFIVEELVVEVVCMHSQRDPSIYDTWICDHLTSMVARYLRENNSGRSCIVSSLVINNQSVAYFGI